jgi:chromate reductase, NAD(P)H dehydrogenase (quinone)
MYSRDIPSIQAPRFLVFSASLRLQSLNTRLAKRTAQQIEDNGGIVDFARFREFDCPSYDQDLENREGIPPAAAEFARRIAACDGLVIASPEYNASFPGGLKNSIDWVTRLRPHPLSGKHALLLSAAPSVMGGNRALWSLRIPLEKLGVHVFPEMFSLAQADQALDATDEIANEKIRAMFLRIVTDYTNLVEATKNYPLLKTIATERLIQAS